MRVLLGSSLVFAATSLALAAPPSRAAWPLPPDPLRAARNTVAPGPTLDMRLRENPGRTLAAGGGLCATTRAFAEWDRALRAAPEEVGVAAWPRRSSLLPLPRTYIQNGVVVIEDNGTVLGYDRLFDLQGRGIRLVPVASGYTASTEPLAYDPSLGSLVIDNQQSFAKHEHVLSQFAFPFAGVMQPSIFVTTNLGIYFSDPSAPGPSQFHEGDLLFDRTPRIGPALMGASLAGYSVYVREDADRAVVTWKTATIDVQATLFASGEIRFSYATFPYQYASFVVVSGNPAWWSDEVVLGGAADPVDVALGKPEDAALDVVATGVRQIAKSDVFFYDIDLVSAIPTSASTLYYEVSVYHAADPSPFATYYLYYVNGAVSWNNAARIEVAGSRVSFGVLHDDATTPSHITVNTWINDGSWSWADGAALDPLTTPAATPSRTMLDASVDLPLTSAAPLFEAFTLPELRPYEVERVLRANFGDLQPDSVAIYQNFDTDIVFYAGGYSTVGNAGADGIGVGSSTDPLSPALLHMNRLGYGWNQSRPYRAVLLNQEFGHHWLYFARVDIGGMASTIVNPDGAHYAGWVHTPAVLPVFQADDSSSLGGSWWTDNLDGSFVSSPALSNFAYNWTDLYLLGLATPAEVDAPANWWYIANPVPSPPSAYWPPGGFRVDTGVREALSVNQIIAVHGPRDPAYPAAPNAFRVPFVLVVRPNQVPVADIDALAGYCLDWITDFDLSTNGRGSVACIANYNQAPDGIIVSPAAPPTIDEGQSVSFAGDALDPNLDPVDYVWTFAGAAPDSPLQNPGAVVFPASGEYDVCLTVTDVPGALPDPEPPCVKVSVRCLTPPGSLGNTLFLIKEAPASLRAFWANELTATDYAVMDATVAAGPFTNEVASGGDGAIGASFVAPASPDLVFYRALGRRGPLCTGTVD